MAHDWTKALSIDPRKNSPGYFEARLVKGGPMVACKMWITETDGGDIEYHASIDGRKTDPDRPEAWPWRAITMEEWCEMTSRAEIARRMYPESPPANPYRPITESQRRLS